ncbi:acetyltransferase [Gammaproteobacteria bacterium]|nr:acetyltransferase [Gammaproteobacteria bacterium]
MSIVDASNERPLVLFGAGGHASVIADIIRSQGKNICAVFSPIKPHLNSPLGDFPFYADDRLIERFDPSLVLIALGIGMRPFQDRRKLIALELLAKKYVFNNIISPSAIVSEQATLGDGVQIMPGAVINSGARIGDHSIINSNSVIEHDTVVGSHCHVAPGAIICGGVNIQDDVFVGAGSIVCESSIVGKGAVISAATLVKGNIAPNMVLKSRKDVHLTPRF